MASEYVIPEFWRNQFPGPAGPVALPFDHPRPPSSSYLRETVGTNLAGSPPPALGLAAFETVLFRLTGQETTVVGAWLPETGMLLPSVSHWNSDAAATLPALAAACAQRLHNAAGHASYPLRELQSWAGADDPVFGRRLFNTAFVWAEGRGEDWPMQDPELGEFLAQCDVVLIAAPAGGAVELRADFDADVFEAETIRRLLGYVRTILDNAALQPETPALRLPMLEAAERDHLVVEFNGTDRAFPPATSLGELIAAQVARTPEAVALTFEGRSLTYRELDARANRLANHLVRRGVGPDVLVGICVERSCEMVIGLLGILKAGGAYVPIDPSYPADRLAYMLEDAAVGVLLTQGHLRETLPPHQAHVLCLDTGWSEVAGESEEAPAPRATPEHLAYMIYTSGSTGRPKGALNTHAGIVNRLRWMQDEYRLSAADSVLQKTPFSFDVSVWEFFWPLLAGARLVVARPEGHRDPDYLVDLIARERITVLHFVPSMLRVFLEARGLERCGSLRDVICSGEALPADLVAAFHAKLGANLHNLYGPTEAAVDVTYWACPRGAALDVVPIGRPVANTQCYILDPHLQPVPIGVPGELHLGGVQIGRGYHCRPELTAEKFIPDPFRTTPGARLYKTGDLCRYLPDGNIEYLGRIDHQVKIRGFRVELGEIEAVLMQHATIKDVVVVAREDAPGDKRLVAYVVLHADTEAAEDAWRRHVKESLPEFMVPADFVVLGALPLSPNGKVDRKALPRPAVASKRAAPEFNPPANELEQKIAGVWCEVLGVAQLDRQTNFFDAGGDSLRLIRVRQRLRDACGIDVAVVALFQHPTVAKLAEYLANSTGGAAETAVANAAQERAQRQRDAARRMQRPGVLRPTP